MRSAAAAAGKRSPLDIAVLAAMEIAEQVLELRHQKERLLTEADERISAFTRRLEDGPGESSSADEEDGRMTPPNPRF